MDARRFGRGFLLLLAVGISLIFFAMVRAFLVALLFAAILAGMAHPLHRRLTRWLRGREALASGVTVLGTLLVLVIPATILIGVVTAEALQVSQRVAPWVQRQIGHPDELDVLLERVPYSDWILPYKSQIVDKAGELAGRVGSLFVSLLASTTRGTAVFFLQLFIMLYAMFFFLRTGRATLDRILYYMPLSATEEQRLVDRFLSVTRATVKGTLLIGLIQGALGALALWIAGIEGAFFWGTIIAVLSIIPGVGPGLVWVPTVIYLLAAGRVGAAIGLAVWFAAIVGTIDNVLRPRFVGQDTKMSDLMILLGTLGGIAVFGATGIVIGPIVAALFVTVWELYGEAFKDVLPPIASRGAEPE